VLTVVDVIRGVAVGGFVVTAGAMLAERLLRDARASIERSMAEVVETPRPSPWLRFDLSLPSPVCILDGGYGVPLRDVPTASSTCVYCGTLRENSAARCDSCGAPHRVRTRRMTTC
jgi:hypothetical protein